MVIVIIIVIVIIGGGAYLLFSSLPKKSKATPKKKTSSDKKKKTKAKTEPTAKGSKETKQAKKTTPSSSDTPYTGELTKVAERRFVLNPKSTFPLTIYGITDDAASEIKEQLERSYKTTVSESIRKLLPIVLRYNTRCKEIDEYVKVFRPIFQSSLNALQTNSASWVSAGAATKTINESADKAISGLEIQLYCDLEILFAGHPKISSAKDDMSKKFGPEIAKFYNSLPTGISKVGNNQKLRKAFEILETKGLAAHGSRVNPKLLLKTMSLDEMVAIVADLNYPSFADKDQAFDAISKLPDLKHRLNSVVNYKEIFEKLPLSAEDQKANELDETAKRDYYREFARLLTTTYFKGGNAITDRQEYTGKSYSFVKGWEISAQKDCCKFCKKQSEKKYDKKNYPRTPIHLGCRCTVITA